jgi:hypothetical protein
MVREDLRQPNIEDTQGPKGNKGYHMLLGNLVYKAELVIFLSQSSYCQLQRAPLLYKAPNSGISEIGTLTDFRDPHLLWSLNLMVSASF